MRALLTSKVILHLVNNKNEVKFRSTFHNTLNGRFLDLPPLNENRSKKDKFDPGKRSSISGFPGKLPRTKDAFKPSQTGSNFYCRKNMLPDPVSARQQPERPKNRGRPNWTGLDLRPATPINVIKITAIGWVEDEVTGTKKIIKKYKHSLSLSPIRNTLAKNKEKYISNALLYSSKNSESRFYDSTQESLNIEAYMQNNSTNAIEEVDEDDYKEYNYCTQYIPKPTRLPSLNHTPRMSIEDTRDFKYSSRKHDSLIFVEENM